MHRILVIANDPNIRSILSELLENLGYDEEIPEDGEEGINLFDEPDNFDLLISDIRMPNTDASEVARYIGNSDKSNPLLVTIRPFPKDFHEEMFDSSLSHPLKRKDFTDMARSFRKTAT